jgi:hypothetical protein
VRAGLVLRLSRGEHDRSCDGALAFRRQEPAHPLDELRREEWVARAVVHGEPALVVCCDVHETRSLELPAEDTLRQRAGNSASPGVGIGHHLRWQLLVEDDVGERDPSAGPQHAEDLRHGASLARREI